MATTRYVSTEGDDGNPGTSKAPVETIDRAIELGATRILMEHGNYFLPATSTIIPPGVVVRGGYLRVPSVDPEDEEDRWFPDHAQTILLKTEIPRTAAFILSPTDSSVVEGGVLENVTILGGFASVELRAGARLTEVILGGGTSSTVLVQQGVAQWPSILDSVQITGGGGAGIQVAGNGNLIARNTMVRNVGGRGISITGTGNVLVEHCVIQGSGSDGIGVLGGGEVTLLNNRILRNSDSGIVVRTTNTIIKGSLLERNEFGIRIIDSSSSLVAYNTIVDNRSSGIFMERSTPDLMYNIIATNRFHGVMEEKELEEDTVGGAVVGNLFWNNTPAQYFDEGDFPWNTADELNINLLNEGPTEDNIVVDPLFAGQAYYDYKLEEDSPAIDRAPAPEMLTTDLDGNQRSVTLRGVAATATDLGAFERQENFVTSFGAEYYLESANPDTGARIKTSPNWYHNSESPFNEIHARYLPGRIRIWSDTLESYGYVARVPEDFEIPVDKIAVSRVTVAKPDGFTGIGMRLRYPIHNPPDVIPLYLVETSNDYPPLPEGRTYEVIFDPRQGEYRTMSLEDQEPYRMGFAFEITDFIDVPWRPYLDMKKFELELIDRDLFDLQFNTEVARYTFNDGTDGWQSSNLTPLFQSPIMRYSGTRQALEFVRPVNNNPEQSYYGIWASPAHDIPQGARIRIEARISSNRPVDQRPGMRLRLATEAFAFSNELVIEGAFRGPALPAEDGSTYIMYATIPVGIKDKEYYFIWEILNFFDPTRVGSIFLEEVIITRTAD